MGWRFLNQGGEVEFEVSSDRDSVHGGIAIYRLVLLWLLLLLAAEVQ